MEYHSDRFCDHSLIAYSGDKIVAVLPANIDGNVLYSHQGLTFGGWVTSITMKTTAMLQLFDQSLEYLNRKNIKTLVYKCIPHLYHLSPAEEDRYALFRHNAKLVTSNVTATIDYRNLGSFSHRRKRGIQKAKILGIRVRESTDYSTFYEMLEYLLLQKFDVEPTHSREELLALAGKFPKNIRLFAAYNNLHMLAGVIIFESTHVAHVQYVASNEEGRKTGALDQLFSYLIHEVFPYKRYFDFGTSNENQGRLLNVGLIEQKESFGACAVEHSIFQLDL